MTRRNTPIGAALALACLCPGATARAAPGVDLDAFADEAYRLLAEVPQRTAELEAVADELDLRLEAAEGEEGASPGMAEVAEAARGLADLDAQMPALVETLSAALGRADGEVQRAVHDGAMRLERAREVTGAVERLRWLAGDLQEALDRVRRKLARCEELGYPKSARTTITDAANPAASASSPAGSAWR